MFVTNAGEQAPEGKPTLLRQLPLRDRDEIAQSRFRGQQIIVTLVTPKLLHIVADCQQTARLVIQKMIIHLRQLVGLLFEALNSRDPLAGTAAGFSDALPERIKPLIFFRRSGVEPLSYCRQQSIIVSCQCAQRRDFADTGEVTEPTGCGRQPKPWGKDLQLMEGGAALSQQSPCPPARIGHGACL